METTRIEGLTSFLVMDFLEKKGISPELTRKLQNELSKKGLFQSSIQLEGPASYNTYQDLKCQFPESKTDILDNVVRNQFKITKERMAIQRERDSLIKKTEEKYNIFDQKKRRERLRKPIRKNNRRDIFENFPAEIFTDCFNKFKSVFGHLRRDVDPEDPIHGSPVYNLLYNKTGQYVISAADDGLIKIWSTINGELINTFIGHNADINSTDLSECGKYLGSCSNDGIVRVWNLETGIPIAVFNDHDEGRTVCSLKFFRIPQDTPSGKIMKTGFASASDDGSIKIYFEEDFIDNDGLINREQKHMTLESGALASKGFSSIEFHQEGFIAAGTNNGSVLIWNRLFEIDSRFIDKHRIIKNEHSKDCHLTLWNKEGNRLITASFDGTAKIWPWICDNFLANKETKSIYVFDGELGKGSDIKCCAVAWSCRGRYAVASFCKRLGKKNEENGLIQSNIQVYDSKLERRVHKFDQTYDGATFENYIFILETHPFNESILLSADYDGKIIIWDICIGVMLNCFVETCAHLGYPLLNSPILDGRFSPDGLGFSIASYYGSVSFYGYGEKDMFMTTPIEQFYSKEFLEFDIDQTSFRVISMQSGQDMHLVPKGQLCKFIS